MVVADSDFASKMKNRQMGTSGGVNMTKSTSISGDMCNLEKTDGSQSDTAVGTVGTDNKKRRPSIGAKMQAMVGMSRKSRSTSQLSQTGEHSGCCNPILLQDLCLPFNYIDRKCCATIIN
ncbi:Regulating synaptic membrane exocytosis protein 2 [Ilyodon furcidens]|uniref:Regulating synaptic membrane exocytosis protein 2 n=1 Tax=Ilyodon furcidens TaxID=33524 RepID=A0ABV0TQ70_9TELE